MSVQECVNDVRKLAENADTMPKIRERIDRCASEMRSVEGFRGKDELRKLQEALEWEAQRAVPTAASQHLEDAAIYAGEILAVGDEGEKGEKR
jgi:hypothetical protein